MADQNPTPPPLPGAVPAKTSALAVTSLVLGILGLFTCGSTALIGVILGIIAIVKVQNSGGRLKGFGLALSGTIVSGVFLLMIPIFAAMLLPALAAAKSKAQEINSLNNEKQLDMAVRMYIADNQNTYPPAATWCDAITRYVGAPKVFQSPADTSGSRCDYAFNAKLGGLKQSNVNPQTVMLFESDGGWDANGGPETMISRPRYGNRMVVAFADGSVQIINRSQVQTLRWDP